MNPSDQNPELSLFQIAAWKSLAIGLLLAGSAFAEQDRAPASWGDWPNWGDQSDGTYRNPVVPGDYSDLDCIRVGADYYAISSTFQFSPGVVILHSRDLVNWTILGHAVSDLTQISPEMNWDRMNRYGKGIWAGSIRYHDKKFRIYFGTPDEGYFMTAATDPAGPWEPLHRMTTAAGWDDCCPFWDDDGQGYFVGTNFREGYRTYLYKLTSDDRDIIPESGKVILTGKSREASKLYKVNGTYYHFFSESKNGGRAVMMQRSKSIDGPYTEMRQLTRGEREAREPNQGGIVQTEKGDWYFLTHHGTGAWEGRCVSLLPVTWIDGWPVIGKVGTDGIGGMVWSGRKPVMGLPVAVPQGSDDFNSTILPPQWEWNYQPRAEKWSLAERPGFLRLQAFKPLRPDDLKAVGNTLTQRSMRARDSVVTVAIDLVGMADGQVAGLCHFARDTSTLGVRQTGNVLTLEFTHDKKVIKGPNLTSRKILFRSTWGLDGLSTWSYSLDGKTFVTFGDSYQLSWGSYRGDRTGIFTYNNSAEKGRIDVDWFHYTYGSPPR